MSSKIQEIEARWGIPFSQLVSGMHAQGLKQRVAAQVVGMNKHTFNKWVNRTHNPWSRPPITVRYRQETGRSFFEDVATLARKHCASRVAAMVGVSSAWNLQLILQRYGKHVEFQPGRSAPEPKEAQLTRITEGEVDRYIAARLSGASGASAAAAVGRTRAAMWRAVKRLRPEVVPELNRMGLISKLRTRQSLKARMWSNNQRTKHNARPHLLAEKMRRKSANTTTS